MNHEERRTLQPQLNIRANIAAVRFEFCTRCVRLPLTSRAFAELLPLSISALLLHKPELVVPRFAVVGREESSWLWRIERVIECEEAIECSGDFGPSDHAASLARNVQDFAAAKVLPEPVEIVGLRIALDVDRKRKSVVGQHSRRNGCVT